LKVPLIRVTISYALTDNDVDACFRDRPCDPSRIGR